MNKLINTDRLSNTANAIRWCNGLTTQYKVMDFENAIYNCVNEYKKHIPNDTISITTNSLNILPSVLDLPIDSFTLQGNSYQFTTTGKNLFDKDNVNKLNGFINDELSFTTSNTARTFYISCKKNTTYTASKISSKLRWAFGSSIIIPTNHNILTTGIRANANTPSITITTGANDIYMCVYYYSSTTETFTEQEILDSIQIEEGSTATSYEPYTNGASPNPDYPQDIEVVKGRNLWDFQTNTGNWHTTKVINGGNMVQTTTDTSAPYTEFKKFLKSGTYIISFTPHSSTSDGFLQIGISNTDATVYGNNIIRNKIFTIEEDREIQFRFQAKRTLNAETLWENIQLEEGSVATPYTPYQNIGVVVKGKNLFKCISGNYTQGISSWNIENGVITMSKNDIAIQGDSLNLIDSSKGQWSMASRDYNIINGQGTYIVSSSVEGVITKDTTKNSFVGLFISKYNSNGEEVGSPYFKYFDGSNVTITLNEGEHIGSYAIYSQFITCENIKIKIQIEKGSTSTQYEPYHEQQVNIPIGTNELCKVGNVSDELVIKDGKAKIIKRIGKVVLDGSENWYGYNPQSGTTKLTNVYAFNFTSYANNNKSNYFSYRTGSQIYSTDVEGISNSSSQIIIRISKNIVQNINAFKNWLSTHNTIVYYQLATPTEIDLGNITIPKGSYIETLTNLDTTYSVKYFKGV